MKAAVVHEFGKPLTIEELDIPDIRPDQILVKMTACGVCHTDLHAASGDWPKKPTVPFIPGHEGVGVVTKVGSNVTWVKEEMKLACRGFTPPAAIANIVWADGKPCAPNSRKPAIP